MKIQRTLEFEEMRTNKPLDSKPQGSSPKSSGDPFHDAVEAYAVEFKVSFPKALVAMSQIPGNGPEFARYAKRVAVQTSHEQLLYTIKKEMEEVNEFEIQVSYLMALNNETRQQSIELVRIHDPLLFSKHQVAIKTKFGRFN